MSRPSREPTQIIESFLRNGRFWDKISSNMGYDLCGYRGISNIGIYKQCFTFHSKCVFPICYFSVLLIIACIEHKEMLATRRDISSIQRTYYVLFIYGMKFTWMIIIVYINLVVDVVSYGC